MQDPMEVDQPPLLAMLAASLNDACWSQMMLPLLRRDGSSANVALVCRQLRHLMQRTAPALQLSRASGQAYHFKPERFPGCSSVSLTMREYEAPEMMQLIFDALTRCGGRLRAGTCTTAVTAAPPTVLDLPTACVRCRVFHACRLPALTQLQLDVRRAQAGDGGDAQVAAALERVRDQLPRLRRLALRITADTAGGAVWAALGSMSALHALHALELEVHHDAPCNGEETDVGPQLARLSTLRQLRCLDVRVYEAGGVRSTAWAAGLTNLTSLRVAVLGFDEPFASLARMTGLLQLDVSHAYIEHGDRDYITQGACNALKSLTALTRLALHNMYDFEWAGFHTKQSLRSLELEEIDQESLPVLAGLPLLTYLRSAWDPFVEKGGARRPLAVCGNIRTLCIADFKASGDCSNIPWPSFPCVEVIVQRDTWSAHEVEGIAEHCTRLTALLLEEDGLGFPDMWKSLYESRRLPNTAAIRSLAQLQKLRRLEFVPFTDGEVAALAELSRLSSLHVYVHDMCSLSFMGVLQLASARNLRVLSLALHGITSRPCDEQAAQALLCGLRHVWELRLALNAQQHAAFKAALAAARAAGLGVPGDVVLTLERPRRFTHGLGFLPLSE